MDAALHLRTVRRWRVGDILFAENDWISGAYLVTDDPEKLLGLGLGWHPYEGTEICVEYITPEQAKAWDGLNSGNGDRLDT